MPPSALAMRRLQRPESPQGATAPYLFAFSAGDIPLLDMQPSATSTVTSQKFFISPAWQQSVPAHADYFFAVHNERPAPPLPPKLFGMRTQFRPLWLLALGSAGNILYGMGAVILERGVWPTSDHNKLPPIGDNPSNAAIVASSGGSAAATALATAVQSGPDVIRAGNPNYNGVWGGRAGGLAVGGVLTAIGAATAVFAAKMLWQDNRRLVRRKHLSAQAPGEPNYTQPNVFFTAHLFGIALLILHRFFIEMVRDDTRTDWAWLATLPGVAGTSIFSVTQAQSASGSELYHGKMPLWRRHILAAISRGGVAMYCLFAAMAGTPGFNPYTRELVRLIAMTSFTGACFLQLTRARQIGGNPSLVQRPSEGTSITPAIRWAAWLVGRTLIGFGPNLFIRGYFTWKFSQNGLTNVTGTGINQHHFDRSGRGIVTDMSLGSAMTTAGFLADLVSIALMRHDAAKASEKRAWTYGVMAGASLGTGCVVAYRGIIELAKERLAQDALWHSTFPGIVGNGLLYAFVPILFSYAELRHGDIPDIPHLPRERLTIILRFLAGTAFPLWCAMSAIRAFNPFGREATLIVASLAFQLATSLPTTTTRRGQPQFDFPRTPGVGITPGPANVRG